MFQFQYGSIKSLHTSGEKKGYLRFQFQYGSIKSHNIPTDLQFLTSFNSNMVRLKGFGGERTQPHSRAFQFQYGSIKSLELTESEDFETCFNSNMVRLKGRVVGNSAYEDAGFNSNMVRLKVLRLKCQSL